MKQFARRMFYGLMALVVAIMVALPFGYLIVNYATLVIALLIMALAFCIGVLIDQLLN